MEKTLTAIIKEIQSGSCPDAAWLDRLVRSRNREMHDANRHVAKRRLLPYYLKEKRLSSDLWLSWNVDERTDKALVDLLKSKPRRTASGVATITVLTKPWPCASECIYCPNDIRMPKSYLSDEPACQRAERNFFDPYLQVSSRLRVLEDMGHVTDKIELIVLGGTWGDYPQSYKTWFVTELFCALNDASSDVLERKSEMRRKRYEDLGYTGDADEIIAMTASVQQGIDAGDLTYNSCVSDFDIALDTDDLSTDEAYERLRLAHEINESCSNRVVGLVIETRPDLIDVDELVKLRRLGCTKIQMGIQSLDNQVLEKNNRNISTGRIADAFALIRLFGFKSHIHFMVNLLGSNPEKDKADYLKLVEDKRFKPDEVKLYPCALVKSSRLMTFYEQGKWHPYTEDELLDVLSFDVINTPPYTRISRMIRDISAKDIVVGNKKTNLRQLVEIKVENDSSNAFDVQEMRIREIATEEIDADDLSMDVVRYDTTVTTEYFIQYVDRDNRLASFCRLSLPKSDAICKLSEKLNDLGLKNPHAIADIEDAFSKRNAMIREVHVYGRVSKIHGHTEGAQHIGLGRKMIDEAIRIAGESGYEALNVISSVGTRRYYRSLGFEDFGLYQRIDIRKPHAPARETTGTAEPSYKERLIASNSSL